MWHDAIKVGLSPFLLSSFLTFLRSRVYWTWFIRACLKILFPIHARYIMLAKLRSATNHFYLLLSGRDEGTCLEYFQGYHWALRRCWLDGCGWELWHSSGCSLPIFKPGTGFVVFWVFTIISCSVFLWFLYSDICIWFLLLDSIRQGMRRRRCG